LNARGLRVIQFSQHTLKTLESTLGFYTPSTDQQKIPRTRPVRSTDLLLPVDPPVDPEHPRARVITVRTLWSTGSVDPANPRLWVLQSVDLPVDRPCLCACCARRSTGPVDRSACLLLLLLFPAAVPLPFIVDFLGDLRRHLASTRHDHHLL